ncbi:MAG: hypothetical protein R3C13_10445 [Hyphomonas sp.]|uniref:hypothetical protein n=1 Tax=Hyphomonas sp. TaxID=87 RepID=UPI0035280B57
MLVAACGGPKRADEPKDDGHVAAAVTAMADAWTGDIQFDTAFNTLDPSLTAVASGTGVATAFDPNDEYWGLPRDEGVDFVAAYCSGCHSLQIVMQQSKDEAHWHELIDWMIHTQGMPEPEADVRAEIEGYLGRNFNGQSH